MGLDNTLNVSELLRRLGVKGDSLGSAPLLESLRLTLNIGDLSDLVPPVGAPIGAASIQSSSGIGTVNRWSLQCRAAGGLTVLTVEATSGDHSLIISDQNLFGATVDSGAFPFSFGQPVASLFRSHAAAAAAFDPDTFGFGGAFPSVLLRGFENWVGPGEFFNIEARGQNSTQDMRISWKEYPAALNP